MTDKFCRKLIRAALSRFAEIECADMYSNIQRMSEEVLLYLKQVGSCNFNETQRLLQERHGTEYSESGILADDIVIAVAILIDKGVVDVDGEIIKLSKGNL